MQAAIKAVIEGAQPPDDVNTDLLFSWATEVLVPNTGYGPRRVLLGTTFTHVVMKTSSQQSLNRGIKRYFDSAFRAVASQFGYSCVVEKDQQTLAEIDPLAIRAYYYQSNRVLLGVMTKILMIQSLVCFGLIVGILISGSFRAVILKTSDTVLCNHKNTPLLWYLEYYIGPLVSILHNQGVYLVRGPPQLA